MPTLQKFRDYHFNATSKVSENTRTLALSAIAIVWLYKTTNSDGSFMIPKELVWPVLWVSLALAFDFLQYIYQSIVWFFIFRAREKDLANGTITESDDHLTVDPWVNNVAYLLFIAKVISLVATYYYIVKHFLKVTLVI